MVSMWVLPGLCGFIQLCTVTIFVSPLICESALMFGDSVMLCRLGDWWEWVCGPYLYGSD